MSRAAAALLGIVVVLAAVRSLVATRTDSFTVDEPWHIVAGVSHFRDGDYRLNPEQPPFVKLIAGVAARDLTLPPIPRLAGKVGERQFVESTMFLRNDADGVQRRVRIAMVTMNALLLGVLAISVWRTFGAPVAVGGSAFLAIDPTVAANMPLVMTDLPLALAGASATLFTAAALQRRKPLDVILAAAAAAIALGTKHSGPIVAIALMLVFLIGLVRGPRTHWRASVLCILIVIGGAWIGLWAMYGFRFAETPTGSEAANAPLEQKLDAVRSLPARQALSLMGSAGLVPRAYVWGLADTIRAGVEGRGIAVVLLGQFYRDRGPIYHWPVVIVAKLPLGLSAAFVIGLATIILWKLPDGWRFPLIAIGMLSALFFFFLARGAAYAGVRHALPLFPAIAIVAGIGLARLMERRCRTGLLILGFVCAGALAYNEAFGGAEGAYRLFSDEGLDIGQRTRDLARYTREELEPRGIVPYVIYGITPQEAQYRSVNIRSARSGDVPPGDDVRVTGTFLVQAKAILRNKDVVALRYAEPVDRVGNMLVYRGTYALPAFVIMPLRRRIDGELSSDKPDLGRVEADSRRLLKLSPDSPLPHVDLGNIAITRGARDEAISHYSEAARLAQQPALKAGVVAKLQELQSSPIGQVRPLRATWGE